MLAQTLCLSFSILYPDSAWLMFSHLFSNQNCCTVHAITYLMLLVACNCTSHYFSDNLLNRFLPYKHFCTFSLLAYQNWNPSAMTSLISNWKPFKHWLQQKVTLIQVIPLLYFHVQGLRKRGQIPLISLSWLNCFIKFMIASLLQVMHGMRHVTPPYPSYTSLIQWN